MRLKRDQECFDNLVFPPTEKGLPPAAPGPGAEGQPGPPWITITPQKRRGAPEQPPNQEDKPGEPEIGKPAKAPERAQVGALSLWVWERGGLRPRGPRFLPGGTEPVAGLRAASCPRLQGCQGGGGAGGSLGRKGQLCSCLLGNEHPEKWSRLT